MLSLQLTYKSGQLFENTQILRWRQTHMHVNKQKNISTMDRWCTYTYYRDMHKISNEWKLKQLQLYKNIIISSIYFPCSHFFKNLSSFFITKFLSRYFSWFKLNWTLFVIKKWLKKGLIDMSLLCHITKSSSIWSHNILDTRAI